MLYSYWKSVLRYYVRFSQIRSHIAPKPSSVSNVKSCQSQGKPVQVMWIASMLMCQLNAVSHSAVHLNTAPFFFVRACNGCDNLAYPGTNLC